MEARERISAAHPERRIRAIRGDNVERAEVLPFRRAEAVAAVIKLEYDVDVAGKRVLTAGHGAYHTAIARDVSVELERLAEDARQVDPHSSIRAINERHVRSADETIGARRVGAAFQRIQRQ